MSRDIQEFVQGFGIGASIGNAMNRTSMQREALDAKMGPPNRELEQFDAGPGASLGLGKRRGGGVTGALGRIGRGIKGVFGGGNSAGGQSSDAGGGSTWGNDGVAPPQVSEQAEEYFAAGGPVGNEVMGPDGYPLPEGTTFSPSGDWAREGALERLREDRFPQRLTPAAAEETGGPAGGPGRRVGAPGMDEEQGYRNLGDDDGSSPEYPQNGPVRTAPFDLTGPGIPRSARDDAELERGNQTMAPQGAVQRSTSQPAGSSTPPGKSGGGGGGGGSTGSGGAATTPSTGGRKPLRDQTRTAAFDPQADKEDPDNVVGKILDGGLTFAQHIFHMNDDGTVTRTGGTGGAIQRAPEEGGGVKEQAQRAFMSGVGAATPQEIAGLDKLVQQQMPDNYAGDIGKARLAIRRMEIIYRHASMTGQTDKANKMAFEIMQFSAGEAARLGGQAVAAYKAGNIPQAIQLTAAAHNEVPDGTFVQVDPSGKQATLYNVNTGKQLQQFPVTPEFLFSTATGYANRSGYWNAIVQRAVQTNPALQKAAKADDPLQQEKTRTQIELNRARTQRALRPPAGRAGRAAKPGPEDLPPEIQSQIEAIDSKRTSKPSAPAGNGGGDEAQTGGTDSNDERVADAEARAAAAEDEVAIGEDDNGGTASEAGGKEPGQSNALPPNSVLRTNSRPGQGVGPTSTAPATPPGNAKTHDGLPARQNSDGSHSTEVSITVTNPRLNGGKPTNIPSMWGGQELDEEGSVDAALKSGQKYPSFKSVDEAVGAAKARSSAGGAAAGPQGNGPAMPADREKPQFDEPNPTDAFEGKNPYTQILGDTKNAKYFGSPAGKAAGAALKKKEKEFNDDVKGWTKRKGDFEKKSAADDKAAAKADQVVYKDGEKMDTIATNIASDVDTRAKDTKTPSIYSASGDEKADAARSKELSNVAYQMHTANKNLAPKQAVDLVARLGRAGNGPEEAKLRAYTPVGKRGGNITLQLNDDPTVKVDLPEDVYKRFDRMVEQRWKANVDAAGKKAEADKPLKEKAKGYLERSGHGALAKYKGSELMTDVANYLTGKNGDGLARDAGRVALKIGRNVTVPMPTGTIGVPKGAVSRYSNSDTVLPPEGT